jgi:hypothetical protein
LEAGGELEMKAKPTVGYSTDGGGDYEDDGVIEKSKMHPCTGTVALHRPYGL